ncbi:MAG: hypothetical protein AAF456_20510 [Planctomycetota bacterium]
MTEEDVQRLKDVDLDDEQITLAVQVISYFNYINRVADGLGIDPEDFMDDVSKPDWLNRKADFSV